MIRLDEGGQEVRFGGKVGVEVDHKFTLENSFREKSFTWLTMTFLFFSAKVEGKSHTRHPQENEISKLIPTKIIIQDPSFGARLIPSDVRCCCFMESTEKKAANHWASHSEWK